jgi:predicted O-methyltransferase YrrM
VFSDEPRSPPALASILRDSAQIDFTMASEPRTGALLRALAATKPGGRLLELGTGTGAGTAWLLDGMDATARLISVDNEPGVMSVARRHLGEDSRVTFVDADGGDFLLEQRDAFDVIYADAWPGKFTHLDVALSLVSPGGVYFVDDLLPQPGWPEDHPPKVERLLRELSARTDFVATQLAWASGLMVLVRTRPY